MWSRSYHSQKANDTFENQIERAQRAVDGCPEEYKEWCQALLVLNNVGLQQLYQKLVFL